MREQAKFCRLLLNLSISVVACVPFAANARSGSNTDILVDARLSAHAYDATEQTKPTPVSSAPGFVQMGAGQGFVDNGKGLQAAAYRNEATREIKIVFRGTEKNSDFFNDIADDGSIAVGQILPLEIAMHKGVAYPTGSNGGVFEKTLADASNFTDRIRKDPSNAGFSVSFSGHSLGGAIAQVEAARTGLPATTFNAPGVKNIVEMLYPGSSCARVDNHIREYDAVVGALRDLCGEVIRYNPVTTTEKNQYSGLEFEVTHPIDTHFIANFIRDLEAGMQPISTTKETAGDPDMALNDILSTVLDHSKREREAIRESGRAMSRGIITAANEAVASMQAGEGSTHDSSDSLAAAQGAFQSSLNAAVRSNSSDESATPSYIDTAGRAWFNGTANISSSDSNKTPKPHTCENDGGGLVHSDDGTPFCKFEVNNRWVPYY